MKIYWDKRDWWWGYYRGNEHHYLIIPPIFCLVIRWKRKHKKSKVKPFDTRITKPLEEKYTNELYDLVHETDQAIEIGRVIEHQSNRGDIVIYPINIRKSKL